MGLRDEKCFAEYHRLLNRDKWSAKSLSGELLRLLVTAFDCPDQALVFGIDESIERRWRPKISKRAIYRDPVRSSRSHFVMCSGLRWMSLMLLTPLPWLAQGVYWALPVLTALCPSEGFYGKKSRQPKSLTDWARQIMQWLARKTQSRNQRVYLVGDGTYATYEQFLEAKQLEIGLVAPLKLNARLFSLPPKKHPTGKRGPIPLVGKRLLSMAKRVTDGRVKWKTVLFSEWYGHKEKKMLVSSGIAIWHKSNKVMVKVKWG